MVDSNSNSHGVESGPPEFGRSEHAGDLTPFLRRLLAGGTLSREASRSAFEGIMSGTAHQAEIGSLLQQYFYGTLPPEPPPLVDATATQPVAVRGGLSQHINLTFLVLGKV